MKHWSLKLAVHWIIRGIQKNVCTLSLDMRTFGCLPSNYNIHMSFWKPQLYKSLRADLWFSKTIFTYNKITSIYYDMATQKISKETLLILIYKRYHQESSNLLNGTLIKSKPDTRIKLLIPNIFFFQNALYWLIQSK